MIEALVGVVRDFPSDDALREKIRGDVRAAERLAVALFGRASSVLPDPPPTDRPINPYAVGLDPKRWEQDGIFEAPGITIDEAREAIPGLDALWDDSVRVPLGPPPGMGPGGPPPGAGGPPGGGPPTGAGGPPPSVGEHAPVGE